VNPEELLAQVEKRRIAPVYFFSGDEEFLKEEAVRRLIAATIEPGMEDFSLDFLEGDASDAASIITLLSTIPMLAERRLVVVRNFQKLPQKDREAVVAFAEKPVPGASLVLITPKVDLKTTLYARLDKASVSVVFPPLYPDKIPGWLQQRARIYGKRISLDACAQIQTLVGDNPGELDSELEKLAVFVGNRPSIESVDVDAALATARAGDGFDLARAIGE
jgi:DNA polymerase-3 subunit delta